MTQVGVCQIVVWSTLLTLFCLPQTDWFLCSPPGCLKFPFCPSLFPLWRGFSECGNLSSLSTSHEGCWTLPVSSFIFFFSGMGIFLILLDVQSLLLVFNRCSVRTVPFLDVFFMHLWREMNSMTSYSAILILLLEIISNRIFWKEQGKGLNISYFPF